MIKSIVIRPSDIPKVEEVDPEKIHEIIGIFHKTVKVLPNSIGYIDGLAPFRKNGPPPNMIATELTIANGETEYKDKILGTMVIMGTKNKNGIEDGELHDISTDTIELMSKLWFRIDGIHKAD